MRPRDEKSPRTLCQLQKGRPRRSVLTCHLTPPHMRPLSPPPGVQKGQIILCRALGSLDSLATSGGLQAGSAGGICQQMKRARRPLQRTLVGGKKLGSSTSFSGFFTQLILQNTPSKFYHQHPANIQTSSKRENANSKVFHVLSIYRVGVRFSRCVFTMIVVQII